MHGEFAGFGGRVDVLEDALYRLFVEARFLAVGDEIGEQAVGTKRAALPCDGDGARVRLAGRRADRAEQVRLQGVSGVPVGAVGAHQQGRVRPIVRDFDWAGVQRRGLEVLQRQTDADARLSPGTDAARDIPLDGGHEVGFPLEGGLREGAEIELQGLALDHRWRVARHAQRQDADARQAGGAEPSELVGVPHVLADELQGAVDADGAALVGAVDGAQHGRVVARWVGGRLAERQVFRQCHQAASRMRQPRRFVTSLAATDMFQSTDVRATTATSTKTPAAAAISASAGPTTSTR